MASVPDPILVSAAVIDLSKRFRGTTTVVASPALAAETIIASLTLSDAIQVVSNVKLFGWAAFTVGTSGVSTQLRIRKTNVTGTVVGDTGAVTNAAASLDALNVPGLDATPALPGQVYVLTLQVASGGAVSTVSAVNLRAEVI